MNTRKFTGDMADQIEKDRDELVALRAKCERLEGAEKALAGRLGDDPDTVKWACEEYVASEDALPDCFDVEDYRLSKAVASLVSANERLEKQCERLEAQSAQMREALVGLVGHYTREDIEYFNEIHPGKVVGENSAKDVVKACNALATTAGTATLSRLEEARWLLECVNQRPKWNLADWLERRDAWLKGGQV